MNEARKGDWMQTYTGRQFWPLDPRADEVCIEDIAHSLSLQCRFAGHCREFYSVAEHSVRVSLCVENLHAGYMRMQPEIAADNFKLWAFAGLLHDAAEAYLVDLPRPVKRSVVGYSEAEERLERVIAQRFGLPYPTPGNLIKLADNVLLATEARDLMAAPPAPWAPMPDPLPDVITPMGWRVAEAWFLSRFDELGGQR